MSRGAQALADCSGALRTTLRRSPLNMLVLLLALAFSGCADKLAEPEDSGSPVRVRLMSAAQYANTIAHVFGQDVSDSVLPPLPPFARTDGLLASGAAFAGLTSDQAQQIQHAAASIAAKVVDVTHRNYLLSCSPISTSEADAACAGQIIRETGRLVFRRPLDENKVSDLVEVAEAATNEAEDFYAGLAIAIEALLISPEAVFIIDVPEPDPDNPGEERLDAYSLASRLSFFLWNGTPDEDLLQAAERGDLHTPEGLAASVNRMLASARLEDGVRAFFDDMMGFDEFASLSKDPIVYPMVTGATLADAREQTLRTTIDHLLNKELDYRDLFTTRDTFMSMRLAAIYRTPASNGWVPYRFPESSSRSGLLTQISFLAAHSHSVRSSPTLRGQALREIFLCQEVPEPPPNVDFSLLEDAGDLATARERLMIHSTNPSCAGCHLITDPMGLALENFDGAGLYRETENGVELDISGELDGAEFEDVSGLAQAMRDHPKLPYCLVNRMYAFGTGGPVSLRYDRDILSYFVGRFAENEYQVPGLLREIATSQAFTRVRPPPTSKVAEVSSGEGATVALNN